MRKVTLEVASREAVNRRSRNALARRAQGTRLTPEIWITGRIFQKQNVLTVRYFLMGKTDEVLIPKPVSNPDRRNELEVDLL